MELSYVGDVVYDDDELERARRVEIYRKQVETIERATPGIWDMRATCSQGARPVFCTELSRTFASAREAARQLGIKKNNVRACIRETRRCKAVVDGQARLLGFRYVEGAAAVRAKLGTERPVFCVEQRRRYLTLTQAADVNDIPVSTLHDRIKSGESTPAGLTFRYAEGAHGDDDNARRIGASQLQLFAAA